MSIIQFAREFLRDLRKVRRQRTEYQRWLVRHMKLRSMEFGPASHLACFDAARAISQSPAETVWVYESLLGRVGRATSYPGRPAVPTLAHLVSLYTK